MHGQVLPQSSGRAVVDLYGCRRIDSLCMFKHASGPEPASQSQPLSGADSSVVALHYPRKLSQAASRLALTSACPRRSGAADAQRPSPHKPTHLSQCHSAAAHCRWRGSRLGRPGTPQLQWRSEELVRCEFISPGGWSSGLERGWPVSRASD